MVHIHVGNVNDSGQLVFLAQLPRLQCPHLNACLTVDNDDSRTGSADCLLYFSHEIKVTGCIDNVDLVSIPFNRNHGGVDGKLALLLFLAVIADGIAVFYSAHSGCNSGQVCHGLCQTGLSAAAVSQ